MRTTLPLLFLTIAGLGCAADRYDAPEALEAYGLDASGAEIIEVGSWPETVPLEAYEVLRHGETEPFLFGVNDLLPRPDGGLYVANARAREILAIDARGALVWRAGQAGQGPGEFQGLRGLQRWAGDTLVTLDGVQGRNVASFWTPDGELARSAVAPPLSVDDERELAFVVPGGFLVGVLSDERLVVHGPERPHATGEPGLRRAEAPLTLLQPGGDGASAPVTLPGVRFYELRVPGGPRGMNLRGMLTPMPGGGGQAIAVERDLFVWARDDAFEVVLFDADARVRRTIRVDEPLEPVTSAIRNAYLEDWRPWFPVDEEIPFPDRIPAFDRVFRAADAAIWARRYHWDQEAGEVWVRFTGGAIRDEVRADGAELAVTYGFPPRVRVMAATTDGVYGVLRDELDVEHIVRFALARNLALRTGRDVSHLAASYLHDSSRSRASANRARRRGISTPA